MDEIIGRKPTRTRRRLTVWAVFGAVGLVMGAAWATGFGTSTPTVSPNNAAAATVFGTGSAVQQSVSPYANAITEPGTLAVSFDGLWGVLSSDTDLFKVDMSGQPAGQTFYVDIYLHDTGGSNLWSAEQYKWLQFDCTSADPVASDFSTAYAVAASNANNTPKLMNITASDAHVSFQGLAGAKKWCFGISHATPDANDSSGTFLTRPDTSTAPSAPTFVATVNRSS